MAVLVTGGLGFIGSAVVRALAARGLHVVILDHMGKGARPSRLDGEWILGDCGDPGALDEAFRSAPIDVVIHCAAWTDVGESVHHPARYYSNNVAKTLELLDRMRTFNIPYLIFSSSAAVYGIPERVPLDESHPCRPINPYGWTKLMVERIVADFSRAYGLQAVSLRYFNAAGGDPRGETTQAMGGAHNLIPALLRATHDPTVRFTLFGTDYPTRDGTCVRDYIHIADLADAHLLALDYLRRGGATDIFNLGNGEGFTVREVIAATEQVTGRSLPVDEGPRREGDPPILTADARKAGQLLGWSPAYPDLLDIVSHAYRSMALPNLCATTV